MSLEGPERRPPANYEGHTRWKERVAVTTLATATTFGQTDVQVSRLGIGVMTWGTPKGLARWTPATLAYGAADGAAAEQQAFAASLAAGVTLFDTAAMYSGGASEQRLGELARGTPAVIATKFPPGLFSRADSLPRELEASLRRLERACVELYQHHFPSSRTPIATVMELMADAVEAGKVRAVGVSNYSAAQMREAHAVLARRGIPLASNQVEYSLLHRQPETNGVLDACRELGVSLIAYQPLASGALTGKYGAHARPSGLRRLLPAFRGRGQEAAQPVVALLREIGAAHGKSPAQVALRWLLEQPQVIPIPGAKNAAQAQANAEALSFSLSPAEVEALGTATAAWRA
ncbi:MAG: aldo/keto reductase [Chloroflexales bacterium]|nr:aldo/keto reductase [Chloroflexales bacterium]